MSDEHCRLSRVEEAVVSLRRDFTESKEATKEDFKDLQCEINEKFDTITNGLSSLKELQQKQQGFVGGVVFAVSSLFAVAGIVISKFWPQWSN